MRNLPPYLPTIVGLFVALGVPFLFLLSRGTVPDESLRPGQVALAIFRMWLPTLILIGLILSWERQSLASIGLRKLSGRDALWALGGFLVGAMTFIITTPLVRVLNLGTTVSGIMRVAEIPIGLRLAIVLSAGITEEILFRGYPIERLNAFFGHIGVSAAIAYLVFVVLHIPFWGLGGAIQIGVWSLVITALYVRRRNLPACMLMHVLNDAYAFIVLPMFVSRLSP